MATMVRLPPFTAVLTVPPVRSPVFRILTVLSLRSMTSGGRLVGPSDEHCAVYLTSPQMTCHDSQAARLKGLLTSSGHSDISNGDWPNIRPVARLLRTQQLLRFDEPWP